MTLWWEGDVLVWRMHCRPQHLGLDHFLMGLAGEQKKLVMHVRAETVSVFVYTSWMVQVVLVRFLVQIEKIVVRDLLSRLVRVAWKVLE